MRIPTVFSLRQATGDDAQLFYDVIDRTMREFIIATWSRWNESRVRQESLEKSISPKARIILVGDVAVGVFVVERHPTHIQLEQIYLLPEYQCLGIGTALINNLIAEAKQSALPICLRVMVVNPATKFYERLGFVVTEATPDFFVMQKAS